MNNFIIKDSPNKGKGLFSLINTPANHILFDFAGTPIVVPAEKLKHYYGDPTANNWLQVGADTYLDLGGHYSLFTNHSCLPNSFVKITSNKAFLVSLRPIIVGEEITFDYSLTSSDTPDTWSMPCNCSLFQCRKLITGFSSLSEKQQQAYIAIGAVPNYVL